VLHVDHQPIDTAACQHLDELHAWHRQQVAQDRPAFAETLLERIVHRQCSAHSMGGRRPWTD
jgi:hypothetical protein